MVQPKNTCQAERIPISDALTIGRQPSEEELRALAEAGFRAVVNLRGEDEDDQPLSPQDEGKFVKQMGLKYVHLPVATDHLQLQQVDRFHQELENLPEPVFVHCDTADRAGAFALMHVAVEEGWSGEQTLKKAEEIGYQCNLPEIRRFIAGFLRSRKEAT
jgi:uncharacterized protein (TIGR01244 family)